MTMRLIRRNGMIRTSLSSDIAGEEALARALDGDTRSWSSFLAGAPHRDGLSVLEASSNPLLSKIVWENGSRLEWLLSPRPFSSSGLSPAEAVIFETRNQLVKQLSGQLSLRAREIPPAGFILYVTEYVGWCLVIRYVMAGNAANLSIIHAIKEPEAIYDMYSLIQTADEKQRSVLRNVLKSPAKLVGHRNAFIHVDRHREVGVFGPSIDTVIFNDILCQLLIDIQTDADRPGATKVIRVMEVGSGNGLLSTSLISTIQGIESLAAFDVEVEAIQCTYRNISIPLKKGGAGVHLVLGGFSPSFVSGSFDLIVSNPPYLPVEATVGRGVSPLMNAVGGTELLEMLVSEGVRLLRQDGALLLVYSDMARPEVEKSLPSYADSLDLGRFSVLFDVEEVFEDPSWRVFLTKERGLRERNGLYHHNIRITALFHRGASQSARPGSALAQVLRMRELLSGESGR